MNWSVAAVIPVIDEVAAIGSLTTGLLARGACCVYVVDGGSRDATRAVALRAGAMVVDEPRRGYGRACLTGAARALATGGRTGGSLGGTATRHPHDVVVFLDGDASCDPRDLPPLLAALETADVALGRRPSARLEAGAMPWHARLGNAFVAAIVSLRTGRRVHDLPPFKAIRSEALERLDLGDERYGWTVEFVARALLDRGLRVREVPVAFRRRRGGSSKVSGSWRTSMAAGRAMIAVAIRATRPGRQVVLMAKAPRANHAKTRLAAELGDSLTADLWAACLADVGRAVAAASAGTGRRPFVMAADRADVRPLATLLGSSFLPLVQRRPGLGAALAEAFLHAFDGGSEAAIAVAADAPALAPERIASGLASLAGPSAAVLGPTPDGGYHLVGLRWRAPRPWWPRALRRRARKRLERRLHAGFGGLATGGSSALEGTRTALAANGWHVTQTEPWPDLDTLADLRTLAGHLAGDGRHAPATRAWIDRHQDVIVRPLNAGSAVSEGAS